MNMEPQRVPRRTFVALALILSLGACQSSDDGPEIIERPDPPMNGPSTIPPEIGRIRPSNGATKQPPGLNVTATFKEAMDASSISTETFSLWAPGNEFVEAQVSYDSGSMTATLDPNGDLPGGKQFTAYLNGVKTAAGSSVDPFHWTFTTD